MKIKFIFLIIFNSIIVIACSQNESNEIIKSIEIIITHKNTENVFYHTYEEYDNNGELTKKYYITKDEENNNKKYRLMYEYQYSNKLMKTIINYQNKDEPLTIEYLHKNGKLVKNTFRFFKNKEEVLKDRRTNYTDYVYIKDTILIKTYHYSSDVNKYLLFNIKEKILDDKKNVIKVIAMDQNRDINTISNYKYENGKVVFEKNSIAEYSYKYDKNNNIIEEIIKTDSYSDTTKFSYIYDDNGNWIERLKFTDNHSDNSSEPSLNSRTERIIEYY